MEYDLIIVSKSSSKQLQHVTRNCIDSARQDGADINVIIVETGNAAVTYDADRIIHFAGPFNYNKALNMGLQFAKGDIHILANNDLIFHKGWSKIGQQMIDNNIHSASALSQVPGQRTFERGDHYYEGYIVGAHLTGWCIFVTRECIAKIGKLDENFDFWYSDNVYAEQLRNANIKHGLFCNVQVDHITSVTLKTLTWRDQRRYSFNAKNKYLSYAG